MTHRKYGRSRQRIHRGMARHPGKRRPKYERMTQAEDSKAFAKAFVNPQASPKKTGTGVSKSTKRVVDTIQPRSHDKKSGFLRRIFQRKTA